VSERSAEGDDGVDFDRDDLDSDSLHDRDFGGDGEGERLGGNVDPGPGLTDPERELADELERTRELERARDRFERFARDSTVGGGGGGSSAERDALAVIDASERFGVDDSEIAQKERDSITEALALHASKPAPPPDEFTFYAHVDKQQTAGKSIVLTLRVPWEHRWEVFKSLDEMPFSALIRLKKAELDA
jgi:hypothetical protein